MCVSSNGFYIRPVEFRESVAMRRDRLSYLTVSKFWIVAETLRSRSEINRNRFVPVCGQHPEHYWLGFIRFWGRFGTHIDDSGQILESFPSPLAQPRLRCFQKLRLQIDSQKNPGEVRVVESRCLALRGSNTWLYFGCKPPPPLLRSLAPFRVVGGLKKFSGFVSSRSAATNAVFSNAKTCRQEHSGDPPS